MENFEKEDRALKEKKRNAESVLDAELLQKSAKRRHEGDAEVSGYIELT